MNTTLMFKTLVGIAKADGEFDSSEKEFILHIASLEGLSSQDLKDLLQAKSNAKELVKTITFDEKIEILINIVKLMKIDGKVVLSEIKYCEKVAKFFGFEEKAVGFLSSMVESNPDIDPNLGRVSFRMKKYLIQPD